METKHILTMVVGGLAITFLNVWAVERDTKLFNSNNPQPKEVVWR